MKRGPRRARSEISERRGKGGDCKKGSWILDGQGRSEKERRKTHRDAREGEKEKGKRRKEGEKEMQRLPYNGAPRAHKLRHNVISSSLFNER